MAKRISIPNELNHLIEKRDQGERRKEDAIRIEQDRRSGTDRRCGDGEKYRPGQVVSRTGVYRCEHCLQTIQMRDVGKSLPSCAQCGNVSEPWYVNLS